MTTTTTPYLRADGRSLDVQSFARALAGALGGKAAIADTDHMGSNIKLPDGIEHDGCEIAGPLKLTVWSAGDNQRVTLRLYPDELDHEATRHFYGADTRLPNITVSTTRPLAQLVADMRRRLFPEAVAPITEQRRRAAESNQYRNKTQTSVDRLRRSLPALQVRDSSGDASPTLYVSRDGLYLNGRVQGEQVTIDRCSMSVEQFMRAFGSLLS